MRVAVVGAGYFAQFQIAAWHRMAGIELAAVADRDPERRAAVLASYPDIAVFSDAERMLAAAPPDLLDIATPPQTHAAMIRAGLSQGVPTIICQKPFATSLEEAEALVAEAEQAGITLAIHENFRFQPWYRAIHGLLAEGALGDVAQARFALRPGDGAGADAYLSRQPYFREMPRFLIRETGIHFIDTFRYLFGEPEAVYADLRRVNPVIAGEDSGIVVFDIGKGARCTFDGNRTLDHAAENRRLTMGEFEIEGTKAALRLNGAGEIGIRVRGALRWEPFPFTFPEGEFGGNCVEAFQTHMRDAVAGEAPLETGAREYLRNLVLEAYIYKSSDEGRKIVL